MKPGAGRGIGQRIAEVLAKSRSYDSLTAEEQAVVRAEWAEGDVVLPLPWGAPEPVVEHPENRGYGAALKTGILFVVATLRDDDTCRSYLPGRLRDMSKTGTTRVTVKPGEAPPRGKTDWARVNAMTDEEVQELVREQMRDWFRGRWFAPNNLGSKALVDRVHGVYVPYWTFDAHAVCPWTAEAGHYYYTTERYRDNQGRSRTRQVRHVRWEPAAGQVQHFFDDEPVPGTHGLRIDLLKRIEPFATAELVPYDTAFLAGFVVEHYQVVLVDAA